MSSELALLHPDKKFVSRNSNRWLLFIYDFLALAIIYFFLYILKPLLSSEKIVSPLSLALYFVMAGVCLFVPRFLFKIYKQVLRYGNTAAIARLLASEFIGGGVFVIAQRLLVDENVGIEKAALLVAIDFCVLVSARISYIYLYQIASFNTKKGRLVGKFLRLVALVDMESNTEAATIKLFRRQPLNFSQDNIVEIRRVIRQFDVHGEVTFIEQINKGYINRTYHITTKSEHNHQHDYILQRINTNVFTDADKLMANYVKVTEHLKDTYKLPGRPGSANVTSCKLAKDGKSYYDDDSGTWRMISYFDDVFSLDIPESKEIFYESGKAFGGFVKAMLDVDPKDIYEIIPNFHNTKMRYAALERSIKEDPVGRVSKVKNEIEFIRLKSKYFGLIADALESGKIPYRICHNDCNLNNILFDKANKLPVALIDLDTVMPSSPLYDFGDSMRIGINTAVDDELDLNKVNCDLKLYESYARGYLEACGDILTKEELELLPYAAQIITMEDGIRFLMDYIDGDTYYHIYYEDQNLRRSRTQLKLADDIESNLPKIRQILQKIYDDLGLDANVLE